ncbi:MAG: hypothetical protein N2C14_20715, partial [Planctomycetales bacterium]
MKSGLPICACVLWAVAGSSVFGQGVSAKFRAPGDDPNAASRGQQSPAPRSNNPADDGQVKLRLVGGTQASGDEVQILAASMETAGAATHEAAKLKGVQPGTTTVKQLDSLWGPYKKTENVQGIERRLYQMEDFQEVEVILEQQTVKLVMITLRIPFPAAALAKDLKLDTVEPVVVRGQTGQILGQAYPERGVMFTADPAA